MEKELFRLLQEIKVDINIIENKDYNEVFRDLVAKECSIETIYISYEELYKRLLKKIKIYSILTCGIFYIKNKDKKKYLDIIFENIFETIENNYNDIKIKKAYARHEKQLNDSKLKQYRKNFEQIDNFIKLANNMTNEEKEKYLSYTMN